MGSPALWGNPGLAQSDGHHEFAHQRAPFHPPIRTFNNFLCLTQNKKRTYLTMASKGSSKDVRRPDLSVYPPPSPPHPFGQPSLSSHQLANHHTSVVGALS